MKRGITRKKCTLCLSPLTRCHHERGNRRSAKPAGGTAIVERYGVPQSVVRDRRAKPKRRAA